MGASEPRLARRQRRQAPRRRGNPVEREHGSDQLEAFLGFENLHQRDTGAIIGVLCAQIAAR